MRLLADRVHVRAERPHDIEVEWAAVDDRLTWSVGNRSDAGVGVEAVAVVYVLDAASEPLRVLRHGYQSWSPTAVATFRVDDDPSRAAGVRSLVLGMHHADPSIAEPGELRSEMVTVLRDVGGSLLLVGFTGGSQHDGTIRVRAAADGSERIEVWVEAYLGGAVLGGGEHRPLHDVVVEEGEGDPAGLLEAWALGVGADQRARVDAAYQVGWCSWYHYFHGVTEADLRANLALAGDWPFDVFQLDDGYQAAIGDWLVTNDRFPSPLDVLAADIAATEHTPGIWLAPFLAAPDSALVQQHPEWLAGHRASGSPLVGMVNDGWGGAVHTLDTTNPEVLDHLERVASELVAAGFPYLKLDFTYAPSLPGTFVDPTRTPAQRVRAGFDALRRGAGPDAFLLGCGAPLGCTVGAVDGMRIGADVAPWWHAPEGSYRPAGHEGGEPATVNAWRNTLSRSFLHRRLWLNDPDCVMLRTDATQLDAAQVRAWALAVGVSGGMALVSDDLALVDAGGRALLDEVVALGREVDAAAARAGGRPPRCIDLLDADPPTRLATETMELVGDPGTGTAHVQGRLAGRPPSGS